MAVQQIHLELLLGRTVRDAQGNAVGRIEEMRAEQRGADWVISAYLVGRAALFERFSVQTIGLSLLHVLGARKSFFGYVVPWNQLDLADPDHPRLHCDVTELETPA